MTPKLPFVLLKTTAGLGLLFALIAHQYDLRTAAAFISTCVAGWLNVFGVLHALVAAARHTAVSGRTWLVALVALVFDVLLIFFGYGLVLALTTAGLLLIDALVLRFAGHPIGHKVIASEP